MSLTEYVAAMTTRGECKCGKCIDVGTTPDPTGHTADVAFFQVSKHTDADAETFRRLTRSHRGEFGECDPFDGSEHGYTELGGWIGDQGLALQYMALGSLLGVFTLLTPKAVIPGISDEQAMELAGRGLVTVYTS